jgi:hypothetical protein
MINRDEDGYAKGKVFIDEGSYNQEINRKTYEYYEFKLAGKTLQKNTINTDHLATGSQGLSTIVIANAEDLQNSTAGACYVDNSFGITMMSEPEYDNATKTLTIQAMQGTINMYQMQSIHFYAESDPYSLCNIYSAGWHIDTKSYNTTDLNTQNVAF